MYIFWKSHLSTNWNMVQTWLICIFFENTKVLDTAVEMFKTFYLNVCYIISCTMVIKETDTESLKSLWICYAWNSNNFIGHLLSKCINPIISGILKTNKIQRRSTFRTLLPKDFLKGTNFIIVFFLCGDIGV